VRTLCALDLKGSMLDAEPIVELLTRLGDQLILVFGSGLHKVGGEGDVSRAHSPDVEVGYVRHAGQAAPYPTAR
jgi:hypothetical protein